MDATLVSAPLSEDIQDGKIHTKESQLRQVLGATAKQQLHQQQGSAGVDASASVVGIVLGGEDPYTGAAIKLEELFFYWLSQKETVEMVEGYVSAVMQGHPPSTEMTAEASSMALRSLNGSHPQLLFYGNNQPPRSPTAASLSSPPTAASLFRRSFLEGNSSTSTPLGTLSSASSSRSDTTPETSFGAKGLPQESISPPRQQQQHIHVCARAGAKAAAARLCASTSAARLSVLQLGHGIAGKGKPYPEDAFEKRKKDIEAVAAAATSPLNGLVSSDLADFTRRLCRLPSVLKKLVHRRIRQLYHGDHPMESTPSEQQAAAVAAVAAAEKEEPISLDALFRFWREEIEPFDSIDRLFRLLKQPSACYLTKEDLAPVLAELLASHPGLEFLRTHPDFQQKYALTVTTRIFYSINRSGSGRITARELRRSKLLDAMRFVDENEDINKETRFFSYEHFYVLYCRFWELDTDRDGFLMREDLLKYGQHSLSNAIVDRIFEVGARPFSDGRGGRRKCADKMAYEDFIYFMLSEEDKGNEASLRYWFECVDVDGDGRITYQEMKYFYNVQLQRMEWLGHELVPFEDVLAQMLDMLKPRDRQNGLVIEDFLVPDRIRITGVFFDALFNLNKFIQFEQRDPFGDRQKREDPFDNDWERFAHRDYQQLAMDEEDNDGYPEDMDGHVASMDVDEGGPEWTMSDEYDEMGFDSHHHHHFGGQGGNSSTGSSSGGGSEGASGEVGGASEAPF